MITLFDNWVIIPDPFCYIVAKESGKKRNKKTGEITPAYRNYGYYSTLGGALKGFNQIIRAQALSNVDVDINGAIEIVQECDNMIAGLISKVVGD